MSIDDLFSNQQEIVDFTFDENVASVFDDMVRRSVPFYSEVQRMLIELTLDFVQESTSIFDLGCSTGTTLCHLASALQGHNDLTLVGVDNSEPMLQLAREKFSSLQGQGPALVLKHLDIDEGMDFQNASVVLLNWTLQFIRPMKREALLRAIFEQLRPGGCLLVSEKILLPDQKLNRRYIDYYLRLKKRNNYNDQEIAKKREALENVLIPYRKQENLELLRQLGFKPVEVFFQWYNFASLIAVKPSPR